MSNKAKIIYKDIKRKPQQVVTVKKYNKIAVYAIICFLFAFMLYFNTFKHSYVLDDNIITNNIIIKKGLQGIPELLSSPYRFGINQTKDNLYRPFSQIMFAIEWQISPNNPNLNHFLNVLFYALSCFLLFIVLRKYLSKSNILIPFVITLLYAAHPIHSEVVANIKSRDEIMSFFFLMLTLLFIHKWFVQRNWKSLVVTLLMFFLALLSKEGVITMLFLFPIMGWYFTDAKPKTIIIGSLSVILPAVIYIAIRHQIISRSNVVATVHVFENILVGATDYVSYFATAVMLLGKYLLLSIIPYQLVCDYGFNQIPIVGLGNPLFIISLLMYLVIGIYIALNFRKKSIVIFGLLFYLITVSMYSNLFFQVGTSFGERLLFLPSLGLCISFVYFVAHWQRVDIIDKVQKSEIQIMKSKPIFTSLLVILILIFSVKTIVRASEWQNEEMLFSTDAERSPNSYNLSMWYGNSLYSKAMTLEDKSIKDTLLLKAIEKYENATTIYPKYYESYNQLSLAWLNIGDINKGLSYAYKALAFDSTYAPIWYNIGRANSQLGDTLKAIEFYKKALKYDPNYADAYFNIGSILGMSQKYEEAIIEFKKCIKANPDYVIAYHFIGVSYQNLNQQEEADRWFEKVRVLDQKKKK